MAAQHVYSVMSLSCRNNETSKRIVFFEHSHASSDVPKFKKQIITVILKEYLKLDNTKCLKLGESYFLQIHGTKMGDRQARFGAMA